MNWWLAWYGFVTILEVFGIVTDIATGHVGGQDYWFVGFLVVAAVAFGFELRSWVGEP